MIASTFLRSTVHGGSEPDLFDPAETYHEASKLYPALVARQAEGIGRLLNDEGLQDAAARPVRRNPQLPAVSLPPPAVCTMPLGATLERRRSTRAFTGSPLGLGLLGTILHAAYGTTPAGRRAVPSGGALYPLDVYVGTLDVDGIGCGISRYDPADHVLEILSADDVRDPLAAASPLPDLLDGAAAIVLVAAVFWRTRFKYGARGYRFALLEAGHAMQNAVLAATALGIGALPLGGYYDDRLDALLGLDGVDESVVYALVLGEASQ